MACGVPSLLFCCLLLLVPHLSCSYHTSYTRGARHVVLCSPNGASPTTFCSDDIPSGDDGGITTPLRVFHRLSPCHPHAGAQRQGKPSAADVLRRDALGLRSLLSVEQADSTKDVVTVPAIGSPYVDYPNAAEYHVAVGCGTPLQRLAVGFDTVSIGLSLLACKPCAAGAPCGNTFDPSQSSSLAQIPCNSLDCPLPASSCSGNPNCVSSVGRNGTVWFNTTVVTDKLTLSGSTGVENFRFACLEMGGSWTGAVESGILDLSQDIHSLASRAPLSPDTVAFSYCLPSSITTHGFLSIAAARPELSNGTETYYTALRSNPLRPNLYFVQLTGITVTGKNIAVPAAGFAGDTLLALRTTFTYLRPDIYAVLREEFVAQMKDYSHRRVAPVGILDTCYNFTGLGTFSMPAIMFEFVGRATLYLELEQTLYPQEPNYYFKVVCLAFAAAPASAPGTVAPVAIIGTLAQSNTEVAYDLRGGKVGFSYHHAC